MTTLPGTATAITAPWLSDVLGYPIDRMTVTPLVGADAGFLGDVARIMIEAPGEPPDAGDRAGEGRPGSVIVKMPPAAADGRRVGAMLGVWAREQAFYLEVAPASPGAAVPYCHLAAGDQDQDHWVLILQDCPSDPLVTRDGATRDQADAAVDAIADLHARWWMAESRFEWMPGFDGPAFGGLASLWADAVPRFLDRYRHLIPDGTDAWLAETPQWLPQWSERVGAEPLTIVHADYRLENLRYHRNVMTIIDWQTALRGPGPMDLSSLLVTGCTIADRRRWEPELLDRYSTRLRAAGTTVDDEWLARSYDENLLWWMGQFANNLARLEPDDADAQAALDTMIERTFAAGADRDVGRLLLTDRDPR